MLQVLSCAPSDHVAHVEGLLAAKQASSRVSRVLSEELAALQGKQLASQSQAQGICCQFEQFCLLLPSALSYVSS